MDKKQLKLIIAGLGILNAITLTLLLLKPSFLNGEGESVATIGKETISRQEWLNELEERYGEDTLRDMVDQEVIRQMAKDYRLEISDKAIERELNVYKALYSSTDSGPKSEDKWREQIKASLLLEELLTKDVKVPEAEMKAFYEQNKNLFEIPASYHLSQIIVDKKKEADSAVQELKDGSSFSALAMERSIDEFSANQGGDLGFINEEDERVAPQVIEAAKSLEPKEWTGPLKLKDGYAIVYLHEKLDGKKYRFEDVKNQIRRQIALEQMNVPISARAFWKEADVSWYYGDTGKQ